MVLFDVPLIDNDILKLALRLMINLFFVSLLIFKAYYPYQQRKTYVFTFFMLNIMVFILCFALKKLELGLGMALGLFAIFGILRYRTGTIRIKEMTYLFLIVGLGAINALTNKKTSYAELFFANCIVVCGAYILEKNLNRPSGKSSLPKAARSAPELEQVIVFDELDLLRPERREDLINNLRYRTGLNVTRVEVMKIDLRAHSANITAFYRDELK